MNKLIKILEEFGDLFDLDLFTFILSNHFKGNVEEDESLILESKKRFLDQSRSQTTREKKFKKVLFIAEILSGIIFIGLIVFLIYILVDIIASDLFGNFFIGFVIVTLAWNIFVFIRIIKDFKKYYKDIKFCNKKLKILDILKNNINSKPENFYDELVKTFEEKKKTKKEKTKKIFFNKEKSNAE